MSYVSLSLFFQSCVHIPSLIKIFVYLSQRRGTELEWEMWRKVPSIPAIATWCIHLHNVSPLLSCFHYKLHRAHTTLFKETRHGEKYVDYCRATEKAWNEPRRLGSWSRVRQKVEWCIRAKIEFLPHATPIYGYSSLKGQLHHHHHFHLLCFETQETKDMQKRIGGEKDSCGSPSLPRDREYACKVHGRAEHLLNAKNQSRAT